MRTNNIKQIENSTTHISIKNILDFDEYLVSSHKPHSLSYIFNSLFRLLAVVITCSFSCILAAIIIHVAGLFTKGFFTQLLVLSLMIVFLTPLWLWLSKFATTLKLRKHVEYFITNKRVIIKKGYILKSVSSVYLSDIFNIKVTFSVINDYYKTGNVKLATYHKWVVLHSLSDYYDVGRYLEEVCQIHKTDDEKKKHK